MRMNLLFSERLKGAGALFGAAVIYSTFGLLIRVLADMFGDYAQVAARMLLAFLFVLAINWIFRKSKEISLVQIGRALLLGIAFASVLVFFTLAIVETKIATAVFLLYAASMITSLVIGTTLFKEKLGLQKIIALVLAFVGLFMYSDLILALSFGVIAAILSGVSEGAANAIRKSLSGVDRSTVLQHQFFAAGVVASIITLLMPAPIVLEVSFWPIVALIVFALLQVKLGDFLLYGFQHFDVNIGTVILATELFFAAIIGYFFFNEILTVKEIVGGLVIFAASIIATLEFKKTAS